MDKPSWQAPHQTGLFPVSVEWEPPFSLLVDLIGHGDHQVVLSLAWPVYAHVSEQYMHLQYMRFHCSTCVCTAAST